jgi:hypothetical protein
MLQVSWAALAKGISSHAQIKTDPQTAEVEATAETDRPQGQLMHGPRPPEHHPSLKGKRGGRGSRQKGNRAERSIVRYLQERGFAAERVPLSGSVRGRFGGDVSVPLLGVDRRCEVKCRANGFRQLYDWLEGADLLVVRSDRHEPLVIVPLRLAAAIAAIAEGRRDEIQSIGVPPLSLETQDGP